MARAGCDMAERRITALLVEDNPGDVRLIEAMLTEASGLSTDVDPTEEGYEILLQHPDDRDDTTWIHVNVVGDGEEAMAFLRREGRYAHAPRPQLILLDLSLPRMHGHEVLDQIKTDDRWRTIPVVVFTSSRSPADVTAAYELNANCYIAKPDDMHEFAEIVKAIEQFWFNAAVLPPGQG